MKKILLTVMLTGSSFIGIYAQSNVGINTMSPNPKAVLDMVPDGVQGIILPRLAGSDTALFSATAADAGLMFYDTTGQTFWYYNGNRWRTFSDSLLGETGSHWTLNSGNVFRTTGRVGIGTNAPTTRLHVNTTSGATEGLLVTGTFNATSSVGDLGAGSRMSFFPGKAAFRAGRVTGTQWNTANTGIHSGAIGYDAIASGGYSFAVGDQPTATASDAIAMGYICQATGASAVAIGFDNRAQAGNSTSIGGANNVSSGLYATSLGGRYNIASGSYSFSAGFDNRASGVSAVCIGSYNTASGMASFTMGENLTAPSAFEFVLGQYNSLYTPSNATGWNNSDRLFVVANGNSTGSRSEAIVTLKNGNTGFGLNNPVYRIDLPNTNGAGGRGRANEWLTYSSLRWKENIQTIENPIAIVKQLRGVSYRHKPEYGGGSTIGFIAEEVHKVLPDIVDMEEDGIYAKAMSYERLTSLLVETAKAQQNLIEELQTKQTETEKELTELKAAVQLLLKNQSETSVSLSVPTHP